MTRVLLVRLSAMGDLVQCLGAIAALHRARPELELVLLTQTAFAPLLQGVDGLHAIVTHDRRGGLRGFWRTRRTLRAQRCDLAIDLQGNWKSALFARLSGARECWGAAAAWRREPASRCLLTRMLPVDGPPHPARVATALVRALAPSIAFELPRVVATAPEVAAVAARLRELGIDAARPFRVVVAGRPQDPRSQRPAALARECAAAALPTLLLVGPLEADLLLPPGVPVLRQPSGRLRELVALGALVAATGGEVVGPDQGPVHVLAAAGARTVVLFGPQDPSATAPPAAEVRRHAAPPPCLPCRRRACRHPQGPVCMDVTAAEARVADLPSMRPLPR